MGEEVKRKGRVARLIASARKARGLSLRALAEAAGCSHAHLADVERGRRRVSPRLARAIARAFGWHAEAMREDWIGDRRNEAVQRWEADDG